MRARCCLKLPSERRRSAALTALLGAGGITASACIYMVPRASGMEQQAHTVAEFYLTGALLGPTVCGEYRRWLGPPAGLDLRRCRIGAAVESTRSDSCGLMRSEHSSSRLGSVALDGSAHRVPAARCAADRGRHRAAAAVVCSPRAALRLLRRPWRAKFSGATSFMSASFPRTWRPLIVAQWKEAA